MDGNRLINYSGTNSNYTHETSQGYVLVKVNYAESGAVGYFSVFYPDGKKATFGYIDNKENRCAYPITSLTDSKDNRIDFEYSFENNKYSISKIKYGGKSLSQHSSEISFKYTDRADYTPIYIGGIEVSQKKLLKSIGIFNHDQELRTYSLTHNYKKVNLLTELNCSSGSELVNPLRFQYGNIEDDQTPEMLNQTWGGFLSQYFTKDCIRLKGKLKANSENDGLIVYPIFNTYGIRKIKNKKYHLMGSTYSPEQKLLVSHELNSVSDPRVIYAEEGFQTLFPADVNGDGVDELVKINLGRVSGSKTNLKITVYNQSMESRVFEIPLEGVVKDGPFTSPISRSYLWGDFTGDGKIKLLTISHDKTFNDKSTTSYFSLIDLDNGTLINEEDRYSFSLSPSDSGNVMVIDYDGDGKADLCYIGSRGIEIYSYEKTILNGKSTYTLRNSYNLSGITKHDLLDKKLLIADLNGDGKSDFILSPPRSIEGERPKRVLDHTGKAGLCKGEYKQITPDHRMYSLYSSYFTDDYRVYVCTTNDKLMYVVHPTEMDTVLTSDGGTDWTVFLSTGSNRLEKKVMPLVRHFDGNEYLFQDINQSGSLDLIIKRGGNISIHLNENGMLEQQPKIANFNIPAQSYLTSANILDYAKMSQLVCINGAEVLCYSCPKDESSSRLLTSMTDSYGLQNISTYNKMSRNSYAYNTGKKTLSYPYSSYFAPINLLSNTSKLLNGNYVLNNSYSYSGAVVNRYGLGFCGFEKITNFDNLNNETTEKTFDPTRFGVPVKAISSLAETNYNYRVNDLNKKIIIQLDNITATDKLKGITLNSSYQYDAYNNPVLEVSDFGNGLKTETSQTYNNVVSEDKYIIGLPLTKTVTQYRNGTTWKQSEQITYDKNNLPTSKIDYVNGNNQVGETKWTYDADNNLESEKSSPYSTSQFLGTSYKYDGGYLWTKTNKMGQITTYSDYNKFGQSKAVTNYKGQSTKYNYDTWGRLTSTHYADGIIENDIIDWGGIGLYTLTHTATGKPATVTHYDELEREVRVGTQNFDGSWTYIDNVYDSKGRLEKTSLPFKGANASLWNTYEYDKYNRPVNISYASGKVDAYAYSGNEVRNTINGITTTNKYDASGLLISAQDTAGIVTYNLRPDGQPESIIAPGNIVTSFKYDNFGRQTAIVDPSVGTKLLSYDSAGNLSGSTDATGKVITSTYNQYGKLTSTVRPEFTTNYTYDVNGLLTAKTSTNGTEKSYKYDEYSRLILEKENVLNGNWLQTIYNYADGNISSSEYTSQSGAITNENYTYTNGTLTEVKLNNNTSVWKLNGEDNFSQPTSVTTGALERNYLYDQYGLPMGRTTGSVQNISYTFDPLKGNLLSRKDNIRNIQENFSYDNLNRLVGFGDKTTGYDEKGNVTSMSDIGHMEYTRADKPYAVSGVDVVGNSIPLRNQKITYASFMRPLTIEENGYKATIDYNADGNRVRTSILNDNGYSTTSHLIDNKYNIYDRSDSGLVEYFYLAGDIYSAPAVYVKDSTGDKQWHLYNICRDYQGSITHITDAQGALVQELSYDAWGRLRNPTDQTVYELGKEPEIFLRRGYTGHEHLVEFGLINMNARLYDPAIGRFLSPDPYVQAPNFSQNFNRYSYGLNNPLIYTDQNGEFVHLAIGAAIGGILNWGIHGFQFNMEGLAYFGVGALSGCLGAGIAGGLTAALSGASFGAGFIGTQAATATIAGSYSGGFFSGLAIGAISGASGGMVTGFGNGMIEGKDFDACLSSGLKDGFIGGITGGAIGGVAGGISAVRNGRNFWTGNYIEKQSSINFHYGNTGSQEKLTPYQKGQQGVEWAMEDFKAEGGTLLGAEVTIEVDGVRIRLDFVGSMENKFKEIEYFLFEVKNGMHARFTPNQKIVIPKLLDHQNFIPRGLNADNAGLPINKVFDKPWKITIIRYY